MLGARNMIFFYRDHKYAKERHIADNELANIANERMRATNSKIREKVDATLVKAAMKSKIFLRMGVKY
jgi:hypothetical protein